MKKRILKFMLCASPLFYSGMATAQTDSLSQNIEDISLEDLMNVKIVSASRKEESSFEAPLSTCAITRKDIDMMGATSIPEALKICPGLIVREMSNGTYDVAIRGLENLPTHEIVGNNKLLLVMVDNRPVFNHLQGGTYWENIPVDLIDVERIEVVSGPSSPLYGPNAVTGVINIITRRPNKDGLYAASTLQYGITKTTIGQLALGYQPSNKFSVLGSVNYNLRDRHDITMYRTSDSTYISDRDTILNNGLREEFKHGIKTASEKFGANLFVDYKPTDKIKISVSGGMNNADALKSLSTSSSLSNFSNRSYYGNVKAEAYNIGAQVSYLTGNQVMTFSAPQYRYDYHTLDMYLDYNLKIKDNFSLRPAISYQEAYINDKPYTVDKNLQGIFNNEAEMTDIAASLKADYTLKKKLRIILAGRADKFKSPDDIYVSYQAMANYMPNDKHNIRFIHAKSNSGSFLIGSDVDLKLPVSGGAPPFVPAVVLNNVGSKDYKLVTNYMYELGYRAKLVKGVQVDLALFNQTMKNFGGNIVDTSIFDLPTFTVNLYGKYANLPQTVVQNGATLGLNVMALNGKLNVRPSITYQETYIYNYSPYLFRKAVDAVYNLDSTVTKRHTGSPTVFGSMFIGYQPISKLNIGLTCYAMSNSIMYGQSSDSKAKNYTQHPSIANIAGKFTTSLKVSYKVIERLSVFVNCRNVFNNSKVEYYATDRIGGIYMAGLTFQY